MYIDRSRILTPRSDHRVSIVGALSRRQIRFHIDFTRPHEETEGNASDYRERIVTGNVCVISIFFPTDSRKRGGELDDGKCAPSFSLIDCSFDMDGYQEIETLYF